MLDDVVVDTNIWVHAQNPGEQRFKASVDFLNILRQCTTTLCIDRVFDITGAQNTSLIGHEYMENLSPGFAYSVLQHLLASARVKSISDRIPNNDKRKLEDLVRNNTKDRRFVRVAYNSVEHYLVSHDLTDFSVRVRSEIQRHLGVEIVEAEVACESIS
jgi:predicted nucleic acid-binding protein